MKPKRSLGQNFLIDQNLQRKIIGSLGDPSEQPLVEIGPGKGALTQHLVGLTDRLVLIELDDELVEDLRTRHGDRPGVEIVHRDVLTVDFGALFPEGIRFRVVGNIPYNITSPIIFKLLERPRPSEILLMVQKEVAERLVADPGTAEYGALTVGVRTVARCEKVFAVPRTAFRPVPKVESAVVRIIPDDPPPLSPAEEAGLRRLTRAAFQWRRKQLQKTLRDHPDLALGKAPVQEIASSTGWDLTRRPETFSPDDFVRISKLLA
ncbi:MAG: 16S rRNA (adenine(1518)-N(6)/adenine(1519)-N(6)) -dimethyltransferase RsmA [Gemmatimonadota bacterium]|nr:MAG: 16S rRNA (adenine(1518)-N(6)/adenine(1519)-N(6)) -dimethyltransferase RsmA [Gemmatimonadota bacterium]